MLREFKLRYISIFNIDTRSVQFIMNRLANIHTVLHRPILQNQRILFEALRYKTDKRVTLVLDQDVETQLEKGMRLRGHPGIRKVPCVQMPIRLRDAANQILLKIKVDREYVTKAFELNNLLQERQRPPEQKDIDVTIKRLLPEVMAMVPAPAGVKEEDLSPGEIESLNDKRKDFLVKKMKTILHRWKPIEYNRDMSMIYMVARLAANYACIWRTLNEIVKEDPAFIPTAVLDYGSGTGSTVWACRELWGTQVGEYLCVDTSSDMNNLAQLLLQDGFRKNGMWIQNVFFRQYLTPSRALKYDLVIADHALLDLPSHRQRMQVVDNLWQKTSKYLVLIDNGTNSGYKVILEARDHILKMERNIADRQGLEAPNVHVFAPCTHDLTCPRSVDGSNTPCNYKVQYFSLIPRMQGDVKSDTFSFVILKKGPRNRNSPSYQWPRIVREVLTKHSHAVCRLCCNDGSLKEIIFTKKYCGKECYQCAKVSLWGDKLPGRVVSATEYLENPSPKANLKILKNLAPPPPSAPPTIEEKVEATPPSKEEKELHLDIESLYPPEPPVTSI